MALVYVLAGVVALLAASLPRVVDRRPITLPVVFLGLGLLAGLPIFGLPVVDPASHPELVEQVCGLVVVISLMGAGLALDRRVGWRSWGVTWRLIGIAMPLTIGLVAAVAGFAMGLPVGLALTVGAILAPTDPVLAGEVKVGEPNDDGGREDEVRFALTSEAGLNDGAAFPFVYLGIAVMAGTFTTGGWLGVDLLYRTSVAVVVGLVIGRLLGMLFVRAGTSALRLAEDSEGFLALAVAFLAYGAVEMLHGYGFLAVFVAACALRGAERSHGYHQVLHRFTEQAERLGSAWILLLLGAALSGGLLSHLTLAGAAVAGALLLVLRPTVAWLAQWGSRAGPRERWAIAFFGIRGVGSLYYLGYAASQMSVDDSVWAMVGFTVALSVLLHGMTAAPAMFRLDRIRTRAARDRRRRGRGSADLADLHP